MDDVSLCQALRDELKKAKQETAAKDQELQRLTLQVPRTHTRHTSFQYKTRSAFVQNIEQAEQLASIDKALKKQTKEAKTAESSLTRSGAPADFSSLLPCLCYAREPDATPCRAPQSTGQVEHHEDGAGKQQLPAHVGAPVHPAGLFFNIIEYRGLKPSSMQFMSYSLLFVSLSDQGQGQKGTTRNDWPCLGHVLTWCALRNSPKRCRVKKCRCLLAPGCARRSAPISL